MTSVYSGGLVYEYSQEASNYGLVTVSGSSVTENADFAALQSALAGTQNPQGDGGYNKTAGASGCPAQIVPDWDVADDALPAIPEPAKNYMTKGAGKGPGLEGTGSQNAGTASKGTATQGSGQASVTASGSASSTHTGAAGHLGVPTFSFTPLVCGAIVVLSSVFGSTLL